MTVRLLKRLELAESGTAPSGVEASGVEASGLSVRELDIVRLIAVGRTNQEICDELFLSLSTVKTYLGRIQAKVEARNRVEIAAWAWEHGAVRPAG